MLEKSDIVVSKMPRHRPQIKRILLVAGCALLVFIVAGLLYWWFVWRDGPDSQRPLTAEQKWEAANVAADSIAEASAAAIEAGDIVRVEQLYNEAIQANQGDSLKQSRLYLNLATALVLLRNDQKAINAAKQAETLDTEGVYAYEILPLIGYAAYRLGDKVVALEYLKRAYDVFERSSHTEAGVLEETKDIIQSLEAQSQ